jgi:hypothetical protein
MIYNIDKEAFMLSRVPSNIELQTTLLQQSTRNIQRLSLIARFDIVAFHPETKRLQVWARKDGANQVIMDVNADWITHEHYFKSLVLLIGHVAQLP